MADRILVKRANESVWDSNNPTLSLGEIGWIEDDKKLIIGDGTNAYRSLGADRFLTAVDKLSVGAHNDVVITTPTSGNFLRYNGSNWVNQGIQNSDIGSGAVTQHIIAIGDSLNIGDLNNVGVTGANDGDVLTFNAGTWGAAAPAGGSSDATHIDGTVIGATGSVGDILVLRAGGWTYEAKPASGSNPALSDVSDVTITSPSDGQALMRNSGNTGWENRAIAEADLPGLTASKITSGTFADARISESSVLQHKGAIRVGDLFDVETSGITTNQVLQWNGSKFIPATLSSGGASNLNDLGDVSTTGATTDQVLTFNGTSWGPATPSSGGGTSNELAQISGKATSFVRVSGTAIVDDMDTLDFNSDTSLFDIDLTTDPGVIKVTTSSTVYIKLNCAIAIQPDELGLSGSYYWAIEKSTDNSTWTELQRAGNYEYGVYAEAREVLKGGVLVTYDNPSTNTYYRCVIIDGGGDGGAGVSDHFYSQFTIVKMK